MTKSALLLMDLQAGIVDRYANDPKYLSRINTAAAAARAGGLAVIWVRVGFRRGHPEVSPKNKSFSSLATGGGFVDSDPASEIHPGLDCHDPDIVVVKRRVSAFSGSDLDVVLRAGDIDSLVLAGIATSGVVLSTLRQAADLDFGLVVLADGCLDADTEVHRVLIEKLFPRQARVTTIADWTAGLA
ncbi:MAG: cysteine hydrolase family protein [Acidimicrobiales bacterium]